MRNLPSDTIREAFELLERDCEQENQAQSYDGTGTPLVGCLADSQSLILFPIFEKGRVIGLYVLEASAPLVELEEAAQKLEHVWTFSTMLVHQMIDIAR